MPMNLEYVLISYGLWVLAFVIYIPWIKQKRKVFQQSLKTSRTFRKNTWTLPEFKMLFSELYAYCLWRSVHVW